MISLAGIFVSIAVTWWKDANSDAKRLRLWDEAKKAVDYWNERLKIIGAALPQLKSDLKSLVALPGLEPGLFALRGRRVNQLHHNASIHSQEAHLSSAFTEYTKPAA